MRASRAASRSFCSGYRRLTFMMLDADIVAVSPTSVWRVLGQAGLLSNFSRFEHRKLMGYSGLVSSEHSSGNRIQRGRITKTGNSHLRRVIVEAAWAYQHRPWLGGYLLKRQRDLKLSEETKEIAWKAQNRLHKRYKRCRREGRIRTRW